MLRQIIGGEDNRTANGNPLVARLMPVGCTAWLISDDLALTAGHCACGYGDQYIEFQVPASLPNGDPQPALPKDRYPVEKKLCNGPPTEIGNDWAVLKIGKNPITKMLPGKAQGGHFVLSRKARPSKLNVTGYGKDSDPPGSRGKENEDNRTQQTDNGQGTPKLKYVAAQSGHGSYLQYAIDTEEGSSGSPVISDDHTARPVAIAIHKGSGPEKDFNNGTAVDNPALESAIKQMGGDLTKIYID